MNERVKERKTYRNRVEGGTMTLPGGSERSSWWNRNFNRPFRAVGVWALTHCTVAFSTAAAPPVVFTLRT